MLLLQAQGHAGRLPVALVIAAACPGRDLCPVPTDPEEVRVHLDGPLAVLRPPGMDAVQVAEMLERAAADLRAEPE